MTFNFSGFEDEMAGEIPSGWTRNVNNNNYSQVIDGKGVIRGEKSFRIGDDDSGGLEQLEHSVGDEDIRFNGQFNRTALRGNSVTVYWYTDAGWWFAAWTDDDTTGEPFRLYFGTGARPNDPTESDIESAADSQVGTISANTPSLFEFKDVTSSLKFKLDDETIYEHGGGFSGASAFRIETDDSEIITDAPGEISKHIYESGEPVLIAGGPQDYVFSGDVRLISEGNSNFTYISGSPIQT